MRMPILTEQGEIINVFFYKHSSGRSSYLMQTEHRGKIVCPTESRSSGALSGHAASEPRACALGPSRMGLIRAYKKFADRHPDCSNQTKHSGVGMQ